MADDDVTGGTMGDRLTLTLPLSGPKERKHPVGGSAVMMPEVRGQRVGVRDI